MLTDRYDLTVSTTVAAARDAYIEGVDLLLTVYPGAASSFDRAIAADPDFALPHVGKARAFQLAGNLAAMRNQADVASKACDEAARLREFPSRYDSARPPMRRPVWPKN